MGVMKLSGLLTLLCSATSAAAAGANGINSTTTVDGLEKRQVSALVEEIVDLIKSAATCAACNVSFCYLKRKRQAKVP
jgi:hypothetical protein